VSLNKIHDLNDKNDGKKEEEKLPYLELRDSKGILEELVWVYLPQKNMVLNVISF
jgi:hypothetical protein